MTSTNPFPESTLDKTKPKRGSVSLARAAPMLVANWDYAKNGSLTPDSVPYASNRPVWWKCQACGEGWQAKVYTVYSNSKKTNFSVLGCPYCAGKRVSTLNCLATKNPRLAAEWDAEKNGDLTPFDVTAMSKRKVWWVCPDGHSYQASPSTRVGNGGRGCPVCTGKLVIPETSLATNYPDLAAQWHPTKNGKLTPGNVTRGSNRRVWWRCPKGHEWQAIVNDRANKNRGCPICAGSSTSRLEMLLYSELRTIFPDLRWRSKETGFEIDLVLPSLRVGIETDGSYWHRDKLEIDIKKNQLAEAAGLTLIRLRERPLKKLSPFDIEYSTQADDLKLIHILLDRVIELTDAADVKMAINSYKALGRLVAESHFRKLAANLPAPPFENSLASVNPDLAKEWNYEKNVPLTPEMFSPKSKRNVWWRCSAKGHEFAAGIGDRANGNGCPYCRGLKVAPENSLATMFPDVAVGWDTDRNGSLSPHDVTRSSNKKVWWKCSKCGAGWMATVDSRTSHNRGCPYCAGKRVNSLNSLATKRPDVAEKWDSHKNGDLTPHDVTMSSRKAVWWRCGKCGESWNAPPYRLSAGHGCPYCSGNKVGISNNLASLRPDLAESWVNELNAGMTPRNVLGGSTKKYWWRCKVCGEVWNASVASRISGRNCPYCAGRKAGRANNLAYKRPDIARSWASDLNSNLTPDAVTVGSHKKVWWRCLECGREWMATVKDRTGKGSGCPFCSNRKKILNR